MSEVVVTDLEARIDQLAEVLGPLAIREHPLGALTTYRVGGPAALFVDATAETDLEVVRAALVTLPEPVPVLALGRGSNMLVADTGFRGLAVRLGGDLALVEVHADQGIVRAGGAADLPVVARRSVEAGLTGFEWAVGVPGSIGGGVRMNAGGHGSDMAATLVRYRWLDLAGAAGGVDGPERLAQGYRSSSIGATEVVVWAELALHPGVVETGRAELREIVRWRRANQPGGANAGSVFTNPPGDSAGRLVDAAGCKGLRLGTAAVSEKHANFIQADAGGSATDVRRVMEHVASQVDRCFGVELRAEVRLVGFDEEMR